jgi:hypothetical protein
LLQVILIGFEFVVTKMQDASTESAQPNASNASTDTDDDIVATALERNLSIIGSSVSPDPNPERQAPIEGLLREFNELHQVGEPGANADFAQTILYTMIYEPLLQLIMQINNHYNSFTGQGFPPRVVLAALRKSLALQKADEGFIRITIEEMLSLKISKLSEEAGWFSLFLLLLLLLLMMLLLLLLMMIMMTSSQH